MTLEIVSDKLLVVEGEDERHFFEALAAAIHVSVQVLPVGGKTKIRENLKLLAISPGFEIVTALGIVRDADDDYAAAFQSVMTALQAAGLPAPAEPEVIVHDRPRTGVFIMPAKNTTGAIETICLDAVRDEAAFQCVEPFFDCLETHGVAHDGASVRAKARVHTYLASKPEPGKRLGEAAKAGYWPLGAAAFARVRDFLEKLHE